MTAPAPNLLTQPRHRIAELARQEIPEGPGVYGWFRSQRCSFIGMAFNLRERLGNPTNRANDLRRHSAALSVDLNVAREYAEQRLDVVSPWLTNAQLAWIECATAADASTLAEQLLSEHHPRLNQG